MYCPSCGEEVAEGSEFCSGCGNPLSEDEAAEAEAAAEPEAPAGQPREEPAHAGAAAGGGHGRAAHDTGVVGGLEENVAGALTYVVGFITGLVFYLIEDDNEFVRFHAMQSMIVFGGLFVLGWVFSFLQAMFGFGGFGFSFGVSMVSWLVGMVLWLVYMAVMVAAFVLWLTLMFKAHGGERWKVPIAGNIAERNA